jgi:hypothetical protein
VHSSDYIATTVAAATATATATTGSGANSNSGGGAGGALKNSMAATLAKLKATSKEFAGLLKQQQDKQDGGFQGNRGLKNKMVDGGTESRGRSRERGGEEQGRERGGASKSRSNSPSHAGNNNEKNLKSGAAGTVKSGTATAPKSLLAVGSVANAAVRGSNSNSNNTSKNNKNSSGSTRLLLPDVASLTSSVGAGSNASRSKAVIIKGDKASPVFTATATATATVGGVGGKIKGTVAAAIADARGAIAVTNNNNSSSNQGNEAKPPSRFYAVATSIVVCYANYSLLELN